MLMSHPRWSLRGESVITRIRKETSREKMLLKEMRREAK